MWVLGDATLFVVWNTRTRRLVIIGRVDEVYSILMKNNFPDTNFSAKNVLYYMNCNLNLIDTNTILNQGHGKL